MVGPLPGRALLGIMLVGFVAGCAAKPPEKPIVLRPHHPERRLVHRPPAAEPPLTNEEKETLFHDFETYLSDHGNSP